jgi:hypothetical protein
MEQPRLPRRMQTAFDGSLVHPLRYIKNIVWV